MNLPALFVFFFITISFSGCSVNNWDVNRYKNKFEQHKVDFEKLVVLLKSENIKINYGVNENELSSDVQNLLHELDIYDVNLNITRCQAVVEYQFTSSWSSKATLYFSKDACETEQSIKGYHNNVSEMIEVWGLGGGWTMWIDHDFI